VYAVETKTLSNPWPKATITVEGDSLRVAGRIPDRNPIEQVTAAARWLESLLEKSTGKRFAVRGVVVFPGWFVEQRSERGSGVGAGTQDAAGVHRAGACGRGAGGCGAGGVSFVEVCAVCDWAIDVAAIVGVSNRPRKPSH
jgi:hypothetical protein